MSRVVDMLKKIYGYGIVIVLFLSGATVFGYIAAMFIGGEIATAICTFIYKQLFLWLVIGANLIVLLGLIAMYLANEKSMTLQKEDKRT